MSNIVYALDKPVGEIWTQEEVNHLVNHYMVEVEQLPRHPSRVVAMNAPLDGKPIYMTWRPKCSVLALPYFARWDNDGTRTSTSGIIVRKYDCIPGGLITEAIQRMVDIVKGRLGTVEAELNGILVSVKDGDTTEERWQWMQAEQDRKRQEYINSDKYKEWLKEEERQQRIRNERVTEISSRAPKTMQVVNNEDYAKYVEINSKDGYSNAVVEYSERWARFMEAELATGKTVAECANETSHLADTEGITGFMYGCAVSGLAKFWKHGEELRRWHNKDTQIGDEGDKANENDGVLNPAILTVRG